MPGFAGQYARWRWWQLRERAAAPGSDCSCTCGQLPWLLLAVTAARSRVLRYQCRC
ncbi:hypothetical protein P378_11605 [Desulforamulus profundi]|uniref:Uncharacterized protein n=1 Tax=Desulforamulus profundi TaxID=1383067 RepID=A0A2C6MFJ7_9FIRM|nr:hypothetical protein P378_11605 [Desulforamulus profundi]